MQLVFEEARKQETVPPPGTGSCKRAGSLWTAAMSSEVEETLKRIQSHRGVKGVLIVSADGVPIRSNLDDDETQTYAALLSQLATKARNVVRVLDDQDELAFFRIRSNKHEIMVAPDPEYLLIVVQENVK